jgi:putative component of toxin-antitoxin plasmid stabilization module
MVKSGCKNAKLFFAEPLVCVHLFSPLNAKPIYQGRLNHKELNNRLDFVPGYRIYFGKDSECVVIILGGGTKKRQQRDINAAKAYWQDYKARKRKSK